MSLLATSSKLIKWKMVTKNSKGTSMKWGCEGNSNPIEILAEQFFR